MGGYASKVSDGMTEKQKAMILAQREIMAAVGLARQRDDFMCFCIFASMVLPTAAFIAWKKSNPVFLGPFVPISASLVYQWDAAYGSKISRMNRETEMILAKERERFVVPRGNRLISQEAYRKIFVD